MKIDGALKFIPKIKPGLILCVPSAAWCIWEGAGMKSVGGVCGFSA